MCVPNWSALVVEDGRADLIQAVTVFGECHHSSIYSKFISLPSNGSFSLDERFCCKEKIKKFPFECIYSRNKIACWQPNKDLPFYELIEIPPRISFVLAQAKLDEEIGNPDKLTIWLSVAKNRVTDSEFLGRLGYNRSERSSRPALVFAMADLLQGKVGNEFLKEVIKAVDSGRNEGVLTLNRERIFKKWCEFFAERNNRIKLWQ